VIKNRIGWRKYLACSAGGKAGCRGAHESEQAGRGSSLRKSAPGGLRYRPEVTKISMRAELEASIEDLKGDRMAPELLFALETG